MRVVCKPRATTTSKLDIYTAVCGNITSTAEVKRSINIAQKSDKHYQICYDNNGMSVWTPYVEFKDWASIELRPLSAAISGSKLDCLLFDKVIRTNYFTANNRADLRTVAIPANNTLTVDMPDILVHSFEFCNYGQAPFIHCRAVKIEGLTSPCDGLFDYISRTFQSHYNVSDNPIVIETE